MTKWVIIFCAFVFSAFASLTTNAQETEKSYFQLTLELAQLNDVESQLRMGRFYKRGLWVPVDDMKSKKWFLRAAENSSTEAQTIIGRMYEDGESVLTDYTKAYSWYSLSAAHGDELAQRYKSKLAKKMTSGQIAKAEQLANMCLANNYKDCEEKYFQFILQQSEIGIADAQYDLGRMHNRGDGMPRNYTDAEKWYRRAANQDFAKAQLALSGLYYRGNGVPKNQTESVRWLRLAANNDDSDAQYGLGVFYKQGIGVVANKGTAKTWFQHSAKNGNARAQWTLGKMYFYGTFDVVQNYIKAHSWFSLSAAQGDENAKMLKYMVASHMTPEQLAEAEQLAATCLANNYKNCD